jgi:plastocyanin
MRTWAAAMVVTAVLATALGGCQQQKKERKPPTPLDPATTGTISGTVTFQGEPPAPAQVTMSAVAECGKLHAGAVPAGDALVTDGKVQNALVYVKSGLGDRVFAVPETPVVIDQQGCLFVPRVAAAQAGQPVRFLNADPFAHNVRGDDFNVSIPFKGQKKDVEIDTPDPAIEVKCDIHPWMKAWLGVFEHPYFAVTGPDGTFTLANVPAGDYVVEVWHERFGSQTTPVSVAPKETKTLGFTFQPK